VILGFGFWTRGERDDFQARAAALGAGFKIHFADASPEQLLERICARNANLPSGSFHIPEASLHEWILWFDCPPRRTGLKTARP
jgi:predicted kinase